MSTGHSGYLQRTERVVRVSVGISQDQTTAGEGTDLSFGGMYRRHAGPFASWMRGEGWTSPLRSRETRPRQMTCRLSRENGEMIDSDGAKQVIYAEDGGGRGVCL